MQDFKSSGIVLFSVESFELIHKAMYRQVLDQLLEKSKLDYAEAEEFILDFYTIFEISKKVIVFD